ncbi:helix-turn-helix transcriptional regulator [Oscillospiraceae bacterium WX1]
MFIDNYMKICMLKGISPTRLLSNLKISKSSYSHWKSGGEPLNETKKKIADYLHISIDELEAGQIKKEPTDENRELSEIDKRIIDGFMKLTDHEKRLVLAQIEAWKSLN